MARVSVTAGYYRRQFYNLEVIDNQNLARDRLEPVHDRDADRSAAADCPAQPITMYSLNANKVGIATDNLRTFSDINTHHLQRLRGEREHAPRQAAAVRRHHHRSARATDCDGTTTTTGDDSARDNPNALRFCDCDAAVPHHLQGVGRVSAAVGLPVERLVPRHPGPERQRQLHRHRGHRRPADHRHRPPARTTIARQPDRAEHGVPRLPEAARPAPRAKLPVRHARASRASPTSSTC